ncbi:MAG TPA: thermonuclease family protein [Pirellulales bacterium]
MQDRTSPRRRQFRRSPYRTLALCIVLALVALSRYWNGEPLEAPPDLAEGLHRVQRVVDGDTIIFEPRVVVRLIGVDTPETVKPEHPVEPFGPEATQFTREFLASREARLTFDRERLDRFGRHLAYVWVGDRLLNEELARAGLARYESHFHYSPVMKRRFQKAQQEAQEAHRGVWSIESPREAAERRAEPVGSQSL